MSCMLLFAMAVVGFSDAAVAGDEIEWMTDYELGLERARIERKPIMIDFYTAWCYYCKVLDAKTYTNQEIIELSEKFVCLKINAERRRDLARTFRIAAYPIIVYLSRDGIETGRSYGYQPPSALRRAMEAPLADRVRLDTLRESYVKRPSDAESAYLYADELMAKGEFSEAEKVLEKVVKDTPKSRAEDANLTLGVCRFSAGDYKQAAVDLRRFTADFQNSIKADEARLYLGLSLWALGKKGEALGLLDELARRLSGTWIGQEAQRKSAAYRRDSE